MKILVRGTNWIGDAIMSVPALKELRRIFPEAHITLHTRSWADGLFRDADFIDEIVTFDKQAWKIREVYDNSRFLKTDKYDLAIVLPNSFASAATVFLSGIPRRIGYNKDLRGLLLTDPLAVPEWKNRQHEVFYYLNIIAETERRMLGSETVGSAAPDISLDVSDERRDEAKRRLDLAGVDILKKIVALGPGSTNSLAKRWPAERYAELSDRLADELDASVILLGSNEERDVAKAVAAVSARRPIDLTGKTDLAEAVALLAVADLLISNDMGLAHVSAAVGTQTITIFGPTDPETTRPYFNNAEVVLEKVECSPCMLRVCPIDHRCMTRISIDRVFGAAERRLITNEEELEETAGYIS